MRFAHLSDRLVTQDGVLMMGVAALVILLATGGDVRVLVVLYAVNVFLTFSLSQLGMVLHWWQVRREDRCWAGRLAVNGKLVLPEERFFSRFLHNQTVTKVEEMLERHGLPTCVLPLVVAGDGIAAAL
jgi:hypothetical protein